MKNPHESHTRSLELEEQINRLNEIGIALSSERNLSTLLKAIIREARKFTCADGGSVYIKEGDRLSFRVAQTESIEKRDNKKKPFTAFYLPLSKESIAGYVALTGKILNIKDVYQIPPTVEFRINKKFDVENNYRSKSMLVVPMRDNNDEVIGVLQLINSLTADGSVIPFKKEYESLVHSLASQAAVAIRNVTLIQEIKNLFRSLVRYSAKAIDSRSPHTAGHSGRVAKYSVRMAKAINDETEGRFADTYFSPEEIEELRMTGWLHDIGKIGVSESILEKANKLTNDQFSVIEQRFENIKTNIYNNILRNQLDMVLNGNDPVKMSNLQKDCVKQTSEINETLAFLKQINVPGYLSQLQLDRLKTISQKTYTDINGNKRVYLTPYEYENLAIVKGNLTADEYSEMKGHVRHTIEILEKIQFTKDLVNIPKYAAAHHECLDGSGYPSGLTADEIFIQSRILCIADIYDALTAADRPYKKVVSTENSIKILRQEVDAGKIDGDIVELFIEKKLYMHPQADEDDE